MNKQTNAAPASQSLPRSSRSLDAGDLSQDLAQVLRPAPAFVPGADWDRAAFVAARKRLATDCAVAADDGRRWLALLTAEFAERRASAYLIGYGIKAFLPMVGRRERQQGRRVVKRWRIEPMFPEYLFVRLDPQGDAWALRRCALVPGALGFLCAPGYCRQPLGVASDADYAVLADDVMRRIEAESNAAVIERGDADIGSIWSIGETVRVEDGPFAGFNGQIARLDRKGRIAVLMSLFGRATPVSFDVDQIAKL